MKSTISKHTEDYIARLEQDEKAGGIPLSYQINLDTIDQLIEENDLQIAGLSFYPQIDLMLVVLNNRRVIKRNISDFKRLQSATYQQLVGYNLSPMGVHWPELDEDLSLRGFLKYELAFLDNPQLA